MMIVVTQRSGEKAAVNTEKIIWVSREEEWNGRCYSHYSLIYCTGCDPLRVMDTPEEIAEMCNLKY